MLFTPDELVCWSDVFTIALHKVNTQDWPGWCNHLCSSNPLDQYLRRAQFYAGSTRWPTYQLSTSLRHMTVSWNVAEELYPSRAGMLYFVQTLLRLQNALRSVVEQEVQMYVLVPRGGSRMQELAPEVAFNMRFAGPLPISLPDLALLRMLWLRGRALERRAHSGTHISVNVVERVRLRALLQQWGDRYDWMHHTATAGALPSVSFMDQADEIEYTAWQGIFAPQCRYILDMVTEVALQYGADTWIRAQILRICQELQPDSEHLERVAGARMTTATINMLHEQMAAGVTGSAPHSRHLRLS